MIICKNEFYKKIKRYSLLTLLLLATWIVNAQKAGKETKQLMVDIKVGASHINPSFVLWIEDAEGTFLRTVFVTENVGKGDYPMARKVSGRWQNGPIYIEGALPVWAHRRGVRNKNGGFAPMPETPVPDAYTGATPMENSRLYLKIDKKKLSKFRLYFEVNQSHDFNDHFIECDEDEESFMSVGQPSVVYGKLIDLSNKQNKYKLLPLGYSDPEGKTGKLYRGFDKFDSALWLIEEIVVSLRD